ncbi:hypothetical protein AA313_de0203617 [Arthrobotrys entomopaga]|nr:hypothetical protein AA313_de0203617 [Arthrobotrys entomopaga]
MAESRGRTSKIPIKEHRVTWRYTKELVVKMTVDRNGMLSPVFLDLEIMQEYSGRERIILGTLELNLAEYVGRERENRRYLMQASKINSTLQISTELKQISGDTSFKVPELRPAQVFSGIAGVVMSEPLASEPVEANSAQTTDSPYGAELSNITAHSRERDRIQDIYRKSLAASWQLQTSELNAVDCIEDIFSGGTGWAGERDQRQTAAIEATQSGNAVGDGDHRTTNSEQFISHRSSSHRGGGWQHNSDSWKRSRSFHNFERQVTDYSTPSFTLASRPNTNFLPKPNAHRSHAIQTRPTVINRTTGGDQMALTPSVVPGSSAQERTAISHPHLQHWHSLEVAEEDLRDNLVSWSL